MSFDPFGHQEPTPPASGGPSGSAGSADPSSQADAVLRKAREKVTLPAVFLIVIGVINLLPGCYFIVNAIFVHSLGAQKFQAQMEQMPAAMKKNLEDLAKQGYTPEDIQKIGLYVNSGLAALMLIVSLLVIIGGIRMLQLRNFGLAVLASVVAAVPLASCLACCGPGEIVGVWSIIVLLSPEVRAAFR